MKRSREEYSEEHEDFLDDLEYQIVARQFLACIVPCEGKNGLMLRDASRAFCKTSVFIFGLNPGLQYNDPPYYLDRTWDDACNKRDILALRSFSCISSDIVHWILSDDASQPDIAWAFEARKHPLRPELKDNNAYVTSQWADELDCDFEKYKPTQRGFWYLDACCAFERHVGRWTDNRFNLLKKSSIQKDLPYDLLIVHLFDQSVQFDSRQTRSSRLREHPLYSRLFARQTANIKMSHTILHKVVVDLGCIGLGTYKNEAAFPVGEVEIWIVKSTLIE